MDKLNYGIIYELMNGLKVNYKQMSAQLTYPSKNGYVFFPEEHTELIKVLLFY